jgi:alanyl-tRNA synthetase
VDTGMGLERLAAVLQHVHSNYEIDLFQALIKAAARETACTDLNNPSLRVIADHIRACSFLIVDGVIPGNDGRGYVLRRIIRRALRHGYKLGQKQPFFHMLVADLSAQMGEAYPELAKDANRVAAVLKAEEERFGETLENGMRILEGELAAGVQTLKGDVAFTLYDTYGFPLDLTQDICRERGVTVDEAGFNTAMEKQRQTARAAGKFKMDKALAYTGPDTAFDGYTQLATEASIVALYVDGVAVQEMEAGQSGIVVLDRTPFYAESGGQVGDSGVLRATGSTVFEVSDTQKVQGSVFGHFGRLKGGNLHIQGKVLAQVDETLRARTMRNHSATHLMHKALREVLGDHVQQKGSEVNAERTRFDFAHSAAMSDEQIRSVEAKVNAEILANSATQARVLPIEDAKKTGAMMLFGEKYGDEVRVLDIGSSRELCGGTHVQRTGDIGLFKIVSESAVAAGVRRVEAVTGEGALALMQQQEQQLAGIAQALKAPATEAVGKVHALLDNVKALEKQLDAVKGKLASAQGDELASSAVDIKGVKFLAAKLDGVDPKSLRETVDQLKSKLKSGVVLLAAADGGNKVQLAAGVTQDLIARVKAGELVNAAALAVGGKGGGRPDFAMAGGTDASKLSDALSAGKAFAEAKL